MRTMLDAQEKIKNAYFSNYKDKIDENMTCDEFIESLTKKEIERALKINAIIEDDDDKFAHILSISMHQKKDVVKELKNNIKELYKNIFIYADETIMIQIEDILENYKNKILELDTSESILRYSISLLEFLKFNYIAKIKYLKSKNKVIIYIPKEIRSILQEIIKDKKIIKIRNKNNIYNKNIQNLISVYGVIPFEELLTIYNKVYKKIKTKDLLKIIELNSFFNESINITEIDDDLLIYGMAFEGEDDALEFYYSQPEELDYKLYTKEEYEMIGKDAYHYSLNEYPKLFGFIGSKFKLTPREKDYFDGMIVLDCLFSYQLDSEMAERNLNHNLEVALGKLNIIDKSFIINTILDMAKNYPNFNYKGHTYNEVKNKR